MRTTLFFVAMMWLVLVPALAQSADEHTGREHIIAPGESLYSIVLESYPEHRGSWLEIAEQIMLLNPDAFPRGLDTTLKLGSVLKMPAGAGQASTPSSAPGERTPLANDTGTSTGTDGSRASSASPANQVANDESGMTGTTASPDASTGTQDVALPTVIGAVTDINGRVIAINVRGQQRPLSLHGKIYVGDTIETGPRGTLFVRTMDQAIYRLMSDSRITVESYAFAPATNAGRSIITLTQGGFHAITGLLGKHSPSFVTYNTAVATIGIRDADFSLYACMDDRCKPAGNGPLWPDGLYAGVMDGVITLTNNFGELLAQKGTFFHIENAERPPVPAPEAAALLFTADELATMDNPVDPAKPLSFWAWLMSFVFGS